MALGNGLAWAGGFLEGRLRAISSFGKREKKVGGMYVIVLPLVVPNGTATVRGKVSKHVVTVLVSENY